MTSLPQNIPFKVSSSDPVSAIRIADRVVVGQLGQTMDGCIATVSGESKYINSDCGLRHLHALRSVVDAVIVGVGSVNADDPKLTVRLCSGNHPTPVILDPNGRVDTSSCLFTQKNAEVIILTSENTVHPAEGIAEIIRIKDDEGRFDPALVVETLQDRGLNRLLVEGGNFTLSRFMDAGVLDRLHLIVAPVIMGGGLSGLRLSPIEKLSEAIRPEVTIYPLGRDVLYDCNLRGS